MATQRDRALRYTRPMRRAIDHVVAPVLELHPDLALAIGVIADGVPIVYGRPRSGSTSSASGCCAWPTLGRVGGRGGEAAQLITSF
jgi:hypothetical protein